MSVTSHLVVPAMPNRNAFYAVDRLESSVVVLVGDDGKAFDLNRSDLPIRVREGAVIRVSIDARGQPQWSTAALDENERERRMNEARERLKKLSDTDQGGDIKL